jgi:hypothetical protein
MIFKFNTFMGNLFSAFWIKVTDYVDSAVAAILSLSKAYTDQKLAAYNPTGQFVGASETYAGLPTTFDGKPINNGDVSFLSKKDGTKAAGIYGYNSSTSTWDYLSKVSIEIMEIVATEQEAIDGTLTDKALSVAHALQLYALKNGSETELFKAADAHVNTKEVVNASQFEMADATPFTWRAYFDWKGIGGSLFANEITQTAAAFTATPVTEAYLNARINQTVTNYSVATNADGTKRITFSNSGYVVLRAGDGTSDGHFLDNMGIIGYLKLSQVSNTGIGGSTIFFATDNNVNAIYLPLATLIAGQAFQNGGLQLQSFFAPALTAIGENPTLDDAVLFDSTAPSFYYNIGTASPTDPDVIAWQGQSAICQSIS